MIFKVKGDNLLIISLSLVGYQVIAELPRAPKAPAGGASIAIEYGEPIEPRKFGYDVMSVRTYVRPYARIRPGDEFAFVLDLESFLRKK